MNSIESQFVPFSAAVKLKELGFSQDEHEHFGRYRLEFDNKPNSYRFQLGIQSPNKDSGTDIIAPLFQQAFDWFRVEHNVRFCIQDISELEWDMFIITIEYLDNNTSLWNTYCEFKETNGQCENIFNTYESARLACLEKLIELVTEKKG